MIHRLNCSADSAQRYSTLFFQQPWQVVQKQKYVYPPPCKKLSSASALTSCEENFFGLVAALSPFLTVQFVFGL